MQVVLKIFVVDEIFVWGYIYYKFLGYEVEDVVIKCQFFKRFSVFNFSELNYFQVYVVKTVLQRLFSFIQVLLLYCQQFIVFLQEVFNCIVDFNRIILFFKGFFGIGKIVIFVIIVYYLVKQNNGQVLVCVFFNIVVD